LVVGRKEEENRKIQTFSQETDFLLRVSDFPGALSLLRGKFVKGDIEKAAAITVHYSKAKKLGKVEVVYRHPGDDQRWSLTVYPASREEIEKLMINE
jgi:predicted ribosome quality control (RQC) complex YloA/Tae2 family protein